MTSSLRYAQTTELHASIAVGSSLAICRGLDKLREDLLAADPEFLFAVPGLFEKIYAGIYSNVDKVRKERVVS